MKEKLKNPFAGYQAKKVDTREAFITQYLATLRRTRAKYEYVTDLAKAVAEQIALVEKKPCSVSTLLRNQRYKALLLNFMATQAGVAGKSPVTDSAASKMLVMAAELESVGHKREVERLKTYVTSLERQLDEIGSTRITGPAVTPGAVLTDDLSNRFAMTCKTLWLVLDHFKDLISVDIDGQQIIDLSAPRKSNVIAAAVDAGAFFEWLQINKSVGK